MNFMPATVSFRGGRFEIERGKNKVLHVEYVSGPEPILTLDGTMIDVCNIFNYLGLPTLLQRSHSPEIRRRLVRHR